MKTALLSLAFFFVSLISPRAGVIAQWNFNSPIPDGNTTTGTTAPAFGAGAASLVGGVAASFSTGSSSDPAGPDNSGWNTTTYPAAAVNNKSAGVQFNVDTTGFENISVGWSQRNTATASRYAHLQYTLDGHTFIDADVIALYADSVFTNKAVDLSAVPGVANNPSFAVRIVSEFESTATGSGADAYAATKTGSTYSGSSGTIRFDMVTISGTLMPGANTPPGISSLADQTLRVGQATLPLSFFIWDNEDPPANLTLNRASSNPAVIPDANILIGGSGGSRTVTVSAGNQPGTATLTLSVIDTGGKSNNTSFTVTVLAANTAPFLSTFSRTNTLMNTATPAIPFTIGDLESAASSLVLSATSANPDLVPAANITFSGSGSNRTVTVNPAPGQTGVTPITISVSDHTNTTSSTFPLMVTSSASIILYEPFAYPDGSLLTNSAFLWGNRSGTFGQCQVTNGQLQISAAQTEDVLAPLLSGPFATNNGTVLYAAFKAKFLALPKSAPGYFAHFADGSQLRGRIYVGTSNAWPGCFRVSVANGSDTATQLPLDLDTNITYTLATRYNVDTATTTLWLNPAAESDPGVNAADTQSPAPVAAYAFRQDADIGATMLIDELKVGLSFASVLPSATANPPLLTIQRSVNRVILSWTNSGFSLQSAPSALGQFTNVPAASSPFTNPVSPTPKFFRLKSI